MFQQLMILKLQKTNLYFTGEYSGLSKCKSQTCIKIFKILRLNFILFLAKNLQRTFYSIFKLLDRE